LRGITVRLISAARISTRFSLGEQDKRQAEKHSGIFYYGLENPSGRRGKKIAHDIFMSYCLVSIAAHTSQSVSVIATEELGPWSK